MKYISSINPYSEEILASYPLLTKEEVEKKIATAYTAFMKWKSTSYDERKKLLLKVSVLLRKNRQQYGEIITLEMGKPITESVSEVEKCAWVCEYYAEHAEKMLQKEQIPTEAKDSYVYFAPLGVIFIIEPWNFPFWQVFRAAAPALMAGNTMLLKHASNVPQSAELIERIFLEAGYNPGVFQNLLLDSSMSPLVINDSRVCSISLTGSERAGAAVASTAGAALKKVVLELGGSDPFIVLSDADVKKAAQMGATSRLLAAGQVCIAAKRFIIHESVVDEFIAEFKRIFLAKKMGDPLLPTTDIGYLASSQILSEIERQVDESVKLGARVVCGGKKGKGKGFFYPPTILTNVTSKIPVYFEETFGPVAAVIVVKNNEEALRVANDTRFGLGASVWTKNKEQVEMFIEKLEVGSVFVNSYVKSDPRLPFGGIKSSGYGRELSPYGLREFTNIKTVVVEE